MVRPLARHKQSTGRFESGLGSVAAACDTIVCFKDRSGDTRRFSDTRNRVGDRLVLFAGLDAHKMAKLTEISF